MAWSSANVTDFCESLINEYNDNKYWAAGELTLYIQAAMSTLLSKYYPFLYPTLGTWADLGVTAGVTEYDYPTNCYKIAQILVKEDGDKLRYIPRNEIWKYREYAAGSVRGWCHKAGQIHMIPEPSATDADYCEIHYMPLLDATTEFPDCMNPLIAIEAAILALLKDKYESPALFTLKKQYEMNVYTDLVLSAMHSPDYMLDFCEDDSLE